MRTLIFDVEGPYAMFRKPFTPVSPISYPIPPPPTMMGIIGAICGYRKGDYLEAVGWEKTRIGVALGCPVQRYRAGINLVNTKGNKNFRLVGENPRIQIPHEFIKEAKYRIFVANANPRAMEDLEGHLRQGTAVYTVSLGLAQCLADVAFVDAVDAQALPDGTHAISTVVPKAQAEKIHYSVGGRYAVLRIPERMGPNRVVTRYSEVVVDEGAKEIPVTTSNAFDVGGRRVLFF